MVYIPLVIVLTSYELEHTIQRTFEMVKEILPSWTFFWLQAKQNYSASYSASEWQHLVWFYWETKEHGICKQSALESHYHKQLQTNPQATRYPNFFNIYNQSGKRRTATWANCYWSTLTVWRNHTDNSIVLKGGFEYLSNWQSHPMSQHPMSQKS